MVGLLPTGIERAAKISGAGTNRQRVWRAPVLYLVNGKIALIEQWRILPAKVERQHCPPVRHHDLTVGVIQLDI
ncbi:hypothetical protein D3C78_1762750 [compost metagenome]